MMTPEEIENVIRNVKKNWKDSPTPQLQRIIAIDSRLLQQIQIRIATLQEIIDGRRPDYKTKQFADRDN